MRALLAALILAIALPAHAAITTVTKNAGGQQWLDIRNTASTAKLNLIEAQATNGSPAVTIPLGKAWEKLRIAIFVTYAASTAVTLATTCSLDGTNFAKVQTRSISSGTATLSDLSDSKTLGAADQDYMVELDVRGCESVKLTLGGDDTDVANLQAVAVR